MTAAKALTLAGLALDAVGAFWLLRGAIRLSDQNIVDITVSRFAGDSDKENIKLPAAQALISERRLARIGAILLGIGFMLQGVGAYLQ